ncbi:hypothetical protein TNCV_2819401 [Trichonephila clavipes]|nr:hypothetical protein TNCV_2819401 [Trichonephila clavipes]
MSSCHSVHDLELAVQDLWAHLPQDNISETFLDWRVNEKIAHTVFRNSEKANGNSLSLSPRFVAMVRREPEEEKGEAVTPLDLCHIGEKVG